MQYDFGYDPESPIQDADIEAMDLRDRARESEARRRAGKCDHGWIQPAKAGDISGPYKCNDCGKVFPSEAALLRERAANLEE